MKIKKNDTVAAAQALVKKPSVEVVTPDVMMDDAGMVRQIREDMANAELGDFCRLRAGVGLVNFRELNAHGQWMGEMMKAFPGKSARTLQRYMQNAGKWLAMVGAETGRAYEKLMSINVEDLKKTIALPPSERKALPERPCSGVSKSVAAENRIANAIVSYAAGDEMPVPEKKPAARISKKEELEAMRLFAVSLAGKVRDWAEGGRNVKTMDTETLEKVQAELTLVVSQIKSELRQRESNGVK